MWAAPRHVVKIGGRGRTEVPGRPGRVLRRALPVAAAGRRARGPAAAGPERAEAGAAGAVRSDAPEAGPGRATTPSKVNAPGEEGRGRGGAIATAQHSRRSVAGGGARSLAADRRAIAPATVEAVVARDRRRRPACAATTRCASTPSGSTGARPDRRRLRDRAARWSRARRPRSRPRCARALELAAGADRARSTSHQREPDVDVTLDGVRLGLRVQPLARVGLYVPGGTARYPSSVLMTAIPAQVAGVRRDRPGARRARRPRPWPRRASPASIACSSSAARRRSPRWPTAPQTVPRVDKIVGPGNLWVAAAKRLVFGAGRHRLDRRAVGGPDRRRRRRRPGVDRRRPARAGRARREARADPGHDVGARWPTRSTPRWPRSSPICRAREIAGARSPSHGVAVVVAVDRRRGRRSPTLRPRAPRARTSRRAALVAARCTTAGAIFVGRVGVGGGRRLPRRRQPRAADRRRRALRLAARRLRLRERTLDRRVRRGRRRAPTPATSRALAAVEGLDGHGRAALIRDGAAVGEVARRGRHRRTW